MKIFLSYPSARKKAAGSLCYELQTEGHDVFFDREDLPAGQGYNERIRAAIESSDLFIFLITPESVAAGRYTLTEVKLAARRWPNPAGHVLPVMLEPTTFEDVPEYLKAVTVLTPAGNVAAEILMEVADLARASAPTAGETSDEERAPESYSYRPVEIRFGRGVAGSYPVEVAESPGGRQPAGPCQLDPAALERELWSGASLVEGTGRRAYLGSGTSSESLLPSADDARRVGAKLYEALFTASGPCLDRSLHSVDPQRREGLRFLINTTDAPELARLPWEFLYSPVEDDFLFSDRMKPVIRWLDVDQPPPRLAVEPPLRLLMAVASPEDRPDLEVGAEIAHLDDALRSLADEGRVEVSRLEHATLESLDEALLRDEPHALHFIGHGDVVGDDGVLLLEDSTLPGRSDPITGRRLSVLLRNHLGSLRFVFLNSCLGAAVSLRNPFGGVAQSLVRRGVPAVIAMQFPISDRVAVSLARHFYRYLATGVPVDTALTSARAVLFARGHEVEWGAPALHMRTPDGRLFEVGPPRPPRAKPPAVVPSAAPAAKPVPAPVLAPDGSEAADSESRPVPSKPQAARPETASGCRIWLLLSLLLVLVPASLLMLPWMLPTRPPEISPSPSPRPGGLYREVAAALDKADVGAALDKLEEARRVSPPDTLDDLPQLRARLFEGFLARKEEMLAAGQGGRLADALLSIDPARARRELGIRGAAAHGLSTHQVRAGDTLWDIADAMYHDPILWPRLFDANRKLIEDPDLIFPGQELVVPEIEPAGPEGAEPGRHRVQRGDCLWSIAASELGDPRLWPSIYENNRHQIRDPDLILPGQSLVIPPVTAENPR